MQKLGEILLRDNFRVRLSPQSYAAGVVAVSVRQDDVFDWRITYGFQQFDVLRSAIGNRSVYDDVAF